MERNILLQNDKITIRENPYKRGIEILFPMKPRRKNKTKFEKRRLQVVKTSAALVGV